MSQTLFDEMPALSSSALEDPRCHNFSVGLTHRMEFYSPGYPAAYPAKVDCFLVLTGSRATIGNGFALELTRVYARTADPGFVIRVDFRDQFDVEPHDECQYDFLEVRDGGHGYSQLIGRYCGRAFPPVITSSTRHLWLRFSSDDNIEYTGFRAVYEFIPDPGTRLVILSLSFSLTFKRFVVEPSRPEGSCRFEMSGLDGVFGRNDIGEEAINLSLKYQVPLDCTWVITVAEFQKVDCLLNTANG